MEVWEKLGQLTGWSKVLRSILVKGFRWSYKVPAERKKHTSLWWFIVLELKKKKNQELTSGVSLISICPWRHHFLSECVASLSVFYLFSNCFYCAFVVGFCISVFPLVCFSKVSLNPCICLELNYLRGVFVISQQSNGWSVVIGTDVHRGQWRAEQEWSAWSRRASPASP